MKDLKFKIVLGFLIVAIVIIIGLCFVVVKQNKAISYQKDVIQGNKWQLDMINSKKCPNEKQIIELEKEVKELKNQIPKKHSIEIKVQNCMKNCNYTTACMLSCTDKSIGDWEKVINDNLFELKKSLNDEQFNLIANSQARWLEYKQAEIETTYGIIYTLKGNMYTLIGKSNIASLYQERALILNLILDIVKENIAD